MRSFYDSIFFNVPPLRFPEFTGEWENTSLGKIGKTFNGLTGKSGSDFGQGFPYITYKSIFDNSKIDISRVEYVEITDVERKKETQNKVQYGDVFFTTSSETPDEVGMSSVLLDEVKDCYLNSFCFGYRLNSLSKTVPEYMRFYLRSQTIRKKMFVLAQGSTRFNISKSEVMGMSINIPEIEEQRKIANLLTLLDDRIATQNKIIEKLQSLIEGLSQRLLTRNNDWVTYKLKDIAQIKSGYSGTQVRVETSYKVSRIETISKHYVDMQRIGYVQNISENYKLNIGDILFSNINSVQYIGNTAYIDKEYGLYHGMNLLRIIPNTIIVLSRFLHLLLCTKKAINHFQTICNKAVSQASINQTDLGNSYFAIPPMAVQQKICRMVEVVKNKIEDERFVVTLQQRQKEYLLKQLFI